VYVEYGLLVRRIDIITGTYRISGQSNPRDSRDPKEALSFVRLAVKQYLEMRKNQPKGINPLH
jgi:hypothetical protein